MLFSVKKIPWWRRKCERCFVAMQQPALVAKARDKVFAHVRAAAVKLHTNLRNSLFSCQNEFLWTIPLMSRKMMSMLLTLLSTCLAILRTRRVYTIRVRLVDSSPNACLIIVRVSEALLPKFAQNLALFLCRIRRSKRKDVTMSTYTQLR
jgi:hypothetical protein